MNPDDDDEEARLRSVALQSGQSILIARRRAEEELRKQSEWLRTTLASIGDGVITTDAQGRVSFMNAVAEALTGWPQADALGRVLTEVMQLRHEVTGELVDNPAMQALETATIVRLANHTLLIDRHGREWPVDDSAAPIRDESGTVTGAVLVFRDVSERKIAEHARAHLAAIVDSSHDAIVSKTLQGIVRSWNGGAERLFGYSADEAIGRPITFLIPPDRLAEEDEILRRIGLGERIDHFETVRVTKQGQYVDISLTVSPIRDASGAIIGASKIARDNRERKRLEETLRQADRQKDAFIALLAHELRNPLAPIRTAFHVMELAEGNPPAVAKARAVIDRQLGHMVRLIDDLLDISRIGQHKLELRRSRILLSDIVSSAVETARPFIDGAGHELSVTLPATPLYLHADLTRLSQVLSNLLCNSAKFTEPGGGIVLAAERQDERLRISVRDTGIGMEAEALHEIFDMFKQIDHGPERARDGLGIGLALVKGLVEMHGGSVTASSEGRGKGSTFTVVLPLVAAPEPLPAPPPTRSRMAGPRRRILVVDDNRDSADSLASMLTFMGHEVQTAYSGRDALATAASFEPALIFIDVGMPDLNGYEVTRLIRAESWGRTIRVIALTGWGQESDRARSKEAGCDDHLVKPVELAALEGVLGDQAPRPDTGPAS